MLRAFMLVSLFAAPAGAQAPVRYSVQFPAPQTHYAEIEARLPTGGRASIEVMLPVWTPGSYLVREYARNLEGLSAAGAITKTRKNRWRIETKGADPVVLRYRVYGREMSVRTNFFDQDFAFISPAATFLTPLEAMSGPYEVHIRRPAHWPHSASGLDAPTADTYLAADYDELVDSPILAGTLTTDGFDVGQRAHSLVTQGGKGRWDNARAAADLRRLVATHQRFWGVVPYTRYTFLNLLVEQGGGLEHADSTVIMTSSWQQKTRKGYVGWLRLASHEFFHTWNVKRLRPVELGPFDYEAENHTRGLWVAEGVTSYYDGLLLRRADLCTVDELLERLSDHIKGVQTSPGRAVDSLEAASFDAWIRFYRPDENTPNTAVSYYGKGAVVAFMLDAEIRRKTKNNKSLDDVMRAAWKQYAGAKGFSDAEFEAVVEQLAPGIGPFFDQYVRGSAELDLAPALAWFGLRFKAKPEAKPNDDPEGGWLGVNTRVDRGRLVISTVLRGSPAHTAGLNVDDEILAFDDQRVLPDELEKRLGYFPAGAGVSVMVARRGTVRRIKVKLGTRPTETWTLEVDPKASSEAAARRTAWLGVVKRP